MSAQQVSPFRSSPGANMPSTAQHGTLPVGAVTHTTPHGVYTGGAANTTGHSSASTFYGSQPTTGQPQVGSTYRGRRISHPSYPSNIPAGGHVTQGEQRVTSERVVSSTVISEQNLNDTPEDSVQYVEVPVVEEVVRHIPKKEVVEIEKRVPRYEYEWVERIVEIPQIQIIDKHVEVPQFQEVIVHVPVKQVVDVPREVVRYVPRIETKIVEQEVEVVGETIEVPKPYLVENKVVVPRYVDKEVATVVSQKLHPIITESDQDFVDVELKEYNPQLIPVDVYIPRPVTRNLIAAGKYEEHRVVDVPPAQYNSLVKNLNGHIPEKDSDAIFVKMQDGTIPMLHGLGSSIVPPLTNEWEKHHHRGQNHIIWTSGMVMPGSTGASAKPVQVTHSGSFVGYSSTSHGGYNNVGNRGQPGAFSTTMHQTHPVRSVSGKIVFPSQHPHSTMTSPSAQHMVFAA